MGLVWMPIAFASYLIQAVASAIDRIIVHREVTKPVVVSFWVATFSLSNFALLLVGLLPFGFAEELKFVAPTPGVLALLYLSGFMIQLSLLYMYKAYRYGEATKVTSVMGAITPIVTLIAAFLILGERLSLAHLLAFAILILGTVVLTKKVGKSKKNDRSLWLPNAFMASVVIAVQSVIAKSIFDQYHFLSAFALFALGYLVYIFTLLVFSADVRREIDAMFSAKDSDKKQAKRSKQQVIWIVGNTILGGIAVLLLNYALKMGSASLVNALRGVQYAGVFIIALLLAHKFPKLLDEELSKRSKMQKTFGILLVTIGIIVIAIFA